jgi:hypothetical protein
VLGGGLIAQIMNAELLDCRAIDFGEKVRGKDHPKTNSTN